jgi:DNA-binding NtrC family response regulator
MAMRTILIISEREETLKEIESSFASDARVVITSGINSALEILRNKRYDFVFVDLSILRAAISGNEYKTVFEPFLRLYSTIKIIVLASKKMMEEAVKTKLGGASDFITYPINPEEVRYVTESIQDSLILKSELHYLRDQLWEKDSLEVTRTKSFIMKTLFEKIRLVAPTRSTVLLVGETGTGKSLFAKLIHKHSNRRSEKFISVHCGAIPDTLLESEIFGHEKGSFTGAIRRKLGKFEIAHRGTIFLDEIGTLSPAAQIKLLQVLQDGTFQRVGGEETIEVDVRVISATNADLEKMCQDGEFRKDLYYRLNVFPIEIPPLRERQEDISQLAKSILEKMNRLNTKVIQEINRRSSMPSYIIPGRETYENWRTSLKGPIFSKPQRS